MDGQHFDALTRAFATATSSRRGVLGGLVAGALALTPFRPPRVARAQDEAVCTAGITCEDSSLDFACGPGEAPDITCVCFTTVDGDLACGKNGCGAACSAGTDCPAGWFCATNTCCEGSNACVEFCRCPTGYADCGGLCLDVGSDPANCGGCDTACPLPSDPNAVATCVGGVCGTACAAGFTPCDGACADLSSDPGNCGSCSASCPAGMSCCSGACADLASDPDHCGSCVSPCNFAETPPELRFICVEGQCLCSAGYVACGGACFLHDERRCHDCIACGDGMTCQGENCVCPSGVICNGNDQQFGPRFTCCGETCCPNSRCRSGEFCETQCVDGACVCVDAELTFCNGFCVPGPCSDDSPTPSPTPTATASGGNLTPTAVGGVSADVTVTPSSDAVTRLPATGSGSGGDDPRWWQAVAGTTGAVTAVAWWRRIVRQRVNPPATADRE